MKKYALVTGGSRGIGRAIAVKLASAGHHVLVNYKSNEEEARKTLEEIAAAGGTAELLPFDVANAGEVTAALEGWHARHGDDCIEVLVNNAGIRRDNLLFWMTDAEWHDVVDTNMNGIFYVTRFLIKYMMNRKYGRVINVVSVSGVNGLAGQANYSAAKAGVIGFTRSLALETARKRVTVNAVAPGFIETDMTRDLHREELKKVIPAGRFGTAGEVAGLVAFLASDEASYITGQVISISGGL
ncbi:MAG: 3-oxoacyl-ACP reductase FabG [Odoribacteraceae bacterium]|jgi:3-oxoacyl-[acyl-carrier protein] reductase|nr:3-oxoacyl-ACP reductase FabG [Odoribacteraceae bacterium]